MLVLAKETGQSERQAITDFFWAASVPRRSRKQIRSFGQLEIHKTLTCRMTLVALSTYLKKSQHIDTYAFVVLKQWRLLKPTV